MKNTKVFGIGFHKTATTSLGDALRILGYRTIGAVGVFDPDVSRKALELALPLAEQYDAFHDNPWCLIYPALDQLFPGSRFILTVRPVQSWIQSAVRHFSGSTTPMRDWIYGVGDAAGRESHFIERYVEHNREVEEYFKQRPQDLLVLHITEGDGWEKLCQFLAKPVPADRFPHSGKAQEWDRYKADPHCEYWIDRD